MNQDTREDYLRVIYSLYEKLEEKSDGIRITDIANDLIITKPSVSRAIKYLSEQEYVSNENYGKVHFRKKGLIEARSIMYKHRLIEEFLIICLKYNKKDINTTIHQEAHLLEHSFSDESIRRIDKMLNYPKTNVFGKEIPRSNLK